MNRWAILALAWCGWVFDIADTAIFNLRKSEMLTQMLGQAGYAQRGPQVEAQIQAVFLLGWSVGGLIFGILADRWGRTRTLVLTVLLYCLFTSLTALCRNPEQVAAARFLTALGIGGEWAAGAALVAEAFAEEFRGVASSVLQTAAAFGPIFAALANRALADRPWQWLFVVGVAPALLCAVLRFSANDPKPVERAVSSPLSEILGSPEWRHRALVAMVIGAVGIMGAGTATFWAPNLIKAASASLNSATVNVRISNATVLSHAGTLAGVFAAPYLCRLIGRRRTIGGFFVAAPLTVLVAIGGGADYSRLLWSLPFVNFFCVGVSAAFVLYFPELFPSRMRATGAGLGYNAGRLLAIPMPLVTAWGIGRFGGSISAGVMLSAAVYLLGLAALPFAPETLGQTLPD